MMIGVAIGAAFVVGLLGQVAVLIWLMVRFNVDRADFSIGAWGLIGLLVVAAMVILPNIKIVP